MDNRTLDYLTKVNAALRKPNNKVVTSPECAECGDVIGVNFDSERHWVLWDSARLEEVVVIGCRGFWQIEPSAVGFDHKKWRGHPGVDVRI